MTKSPGRVADSPAQLVSVKQRMRRRRIFGAMTVALAVLFFASLASADTATTAAPALPRVQSVKKLGLVRQNVVITMRDGTQSALFRGKSVWTFGDTAMSVAGTSGSNWTTIPCPGPKTSMRLAASRSNTTLPTARASRANFCRKPATRRPTTLGMKAGMQAEPCGAEFALWSAQVVADPARDRLLMFYVDIWRVAGNVNWRTVGTGIAVWKPGRRWCAHRRPAVQNTDTDVERRRSRLYRRFGRGRRSDVFLRLQPGMGRAALPRRAREAADALEQRRLALLRRRR